MQRLADISIDLDGEDFVFRVRPGARLKAALARMSLFTAADEGAKIIATAAPAPDLSTEPDLFDALRPASVNQTPPIVHPIDPRSAGAPPRQQSNLAPAPERATPEKPPIRSAISPTQPPPADRTAERTDARPDNKSNAAYARAKGQDGDEIVRRYVEDRESVVSLAACFTGGDHKQIREVLEARGVRLRTRSETQRIAWEKRNAGKLSGAAPIEPKPKPLVIPVDAPRKQVPLAQARPVVATGPKERSKALADAKAASFKRKAHAARTSGMTPAEQQDAVAKFFAEGNVITEIQTPPIEQVKRPAVGMSDGRRRG